MCDSFVDTATLISAPLDRLVDSFGPYASLAALLIQELKRSIFDTLDDLTPYFTRTREKDNAYLDLSCEMYVSNGGCLVLSVSLMVSMLEQPKIKN